MPLLTGSRVRGVKILHHSKKHMFQKKHFFQRVIALSLFFLFGCSPKQQAGEKPVVSQSDSASVSTNTGNSIDKNSDPEISIKIFKNELPLEGYGYDILVKGSPYVHQPNIPAVPGNKGFSTEAAARKTAEFVVFKIKNKILPPSVEVRELDSIGVLK